MRKNLLRAYCFLMAAILVFSLFGCNNMNSNGPTEGAGSTTTDSGDSELHDTKNESSLVDSTLDTTVSDETIEDLPNTSTTEQTKPEDPSNSADGKDGEAEADGSSQPNTEETMDATEPPVETTSPSETEETEPTHQHSYSSSVVAPTCTKQGYTQYTCDCGDSYKDAYTSEKGHDYSSSSVTATCTKQGYTTYTCRICGHSYTSDYSDRLPHSLMVSEQVDATVEAEGYRIWNCTYGCGYSETETLEKLPEYIDIEALEEHGRQYAVETYGYEVCLDFTHDTAPGYCPAAQRTIRTMEEGRAFVEECVDATTEHLIACGSEIVEIIDGVACRALINVDLEWRGGSLYWGWVYYG